MDGSSPAQSCDLSQKPGPSGLKRKLLWRNASSEEGILNVDEYIFEDDDMLPPSKSSHDMFDDRTDAQPFVKTMRQSAKKYAKPGPSTSHSNDQSYVQSPYVEKSSSSSAPFGRYCPLCKLIVAREWAVHYKWKHKGVSAEERDRLLQEANSRVKKLSYTSVLSYEDTVGRIFGKITHENIDKQRAIVSLFVGMGVIIHNIPKEFGDPKSIFAPSVTLPQAPRSPYHRVPSRSVFHDQPSTSLPLHATAKKIPAVFFEQIQEDRCFDLSEDDTKYAGYIKVTTLGRKAAASTAMAEKGLYRQLHVDQHALLRRLSQTIREDVNTTGMSDDELRRIGMRHPEVYTTGIKNYINYVAKIMLFAMRSRGRLDISLFWNPVFIGMELTIDDVCFVRPAFDLYMKTLKELRVEPSTVSGYCKAMKYFVRMVLSEINTDEQEDNRVGCFTVLYSYLEQQTSRGVRNYARLSQTRKLFNID